MGNDEQGSLTLPCLLATLVIVTAGFGIWGVLRQWRGRVEAQLVLDECVGRKTLELKALLQKLDSSNDRMRWIRKSAVVGLLAPEALQAIRAELEAERVLQEGLRLAWNATAVVAFAGRGCEELPAARSLSYPILTWERLPEDAIGPQPFRWEDPQPSFRLDTVYKNLGSATVIKQGDSDALLTSRNGWKARWTPSAFQAIGIGTSFH